MARSGLQSFLPPKSDFFAPKRSGLPSKNGAGWLAIELLCILGPENELAQILHASLTFFKVGGGSESTKTRLMSLIADHLKHISDLEKAAKWRDIRIGRKGSKLPFLCEA